MKGLMSAFIFLGFKNKNKIIKEKYNKKIKQERNN
jgi:hypothetical protein